MSTLLIVEDNDDIRELTAEFFRGEGYEVLEAENGQEALDLLDGAATKPCMLLIDLMMPVMSGLELLQKLEAEGHLHRYPVIAISAGNFVHADVPQARKLLRKPPNFDALLQLVKEYCPASIGTSDHGVSGV